MHANYAVESSRRESAPTRSARKLSGGRDVVARQFITTSNTTSCSVATTTRTPYTRKSLERGRMLRFRLRWLCDDARRKKQFSAMSATNGDDGVPFFLFFFVSSSPATIQRRAAARSGSKLEKRRAQLRHVVARDSVQFTGKNPRSSTQMRETENGFKYAGVGTDGRWVPRESRRGLHQDVQRI